MQQGTQTVILEALKKDDLAMLRDTLIKEMASNPVLPLAKSETSIIFDDPPSLIEAAAFFGSEKCFFYVVSVCSKPGFNKPIYTKLLCCAAHGKNLKILYFVSGKCDGRGIHSNVIYDPIAAAVDVGFLDGIKHLYTLGHPLDLTDYSRNGVIVRAAMHEYLDILEFFVLINPEITSMNTTNGNLLEIAAKYNLQALFLFAIENGFQVCSVPSGKTALYFAVKRLSYGMTEMLLQYGADPNLKTSNGSTPLHYAVMKNDIPIVLALINYGADVNLYDKKYYTPLSIAAKHNHFEMAQILISYGAQIQVNTALNSIVVAFNSKSMEVYEYLLDCAGIDEINTSNRQIEENYLSHRKNRHRTPKNSDRKKSDDSDSA